MELCGMKPKSFHFASRSCDSRSCDSRPCDPPTAEEFSQNLVLLKNHTETPKLSHRICFKFAANTNQRLEEIFSKLCSLLGSWPRFGARGVIFAGVGGAVLVTRPCGAVGNPRSSRRLQALSDGDTAARDGSLPGGKCTADRGLGFRPNVHLFRWSPFEFVTDPVWTVVFSCIRWMH